jgi:hypothetical protein
VESIRETREPSWSRSPVLGGVPRCSGRITRDSDNGGNTYPHCPSGRRCDRRYVLCENPPVGAGHFMGPGARQPFASHIHMRCTGFYSCRTMYACGHSELRMSYQAKRASGWRVP